MKIMILPLVAIIGVIGVTQFAGLPQAKVTTHVIGEDGEPVSGVSATFGFEGQFDENAIVNVNGITDANGNFTAEGYTPGPVGSKLNKDGYYMGWANIPNFMKDDGLGHWQPWDQIYTSVLRKIENPIPMYAKTVEINIPAVGIPCGYDLMAGDWVGPYGKGRKADLIFTLQRQWQDVYHFDVSVAVTFSNSGDGIMLTNLHKEFANSQFKWPRMAPETDYASSLSLKSSANQTGHDTNFQTNVASDQDYFFRVRTTELNGKVSSALYGKIAGGMILRPGASKTCKIHLAYYLNPTSNDRNMEYNPQQDLFKNLDYMETPRAP